MNDYPVGIFDSGEGGKTVLKSALTVLKNESFVYVSDALGAGWGELLKEEITSRAVKLTDILVNKYRCKAVVIACNTATETCADILRQKYGVPFIGVEPAVLPAARAYKNGKIIVLCTPAAAARPRLYELIKISGHKNVKVLPQKGLARKIEEKLNCINYFEPFTRSIIKKENPQAIVLGCTHYVYLKPLFCSLIGASRVFDGNEGAVNRLKAVLYKNGLDSGKNGGNVIYIKG